jgi:hypothetical protein
MPTKKYKKSSSACPVDPDPQRCFKRFLRILLKEKNIFFRKRMAEIQYIIFQEYLG